MALYLRRLLQKASLRHWVDSTWYRAAVSGGAFPHSMQGRASVYFFKETRAGVRMPKSFIYLIAVIGLAFSVAPMADEVSPATTAVGTSSDKASTTVAVDSTKEECHATRMSEVLLRQRHCCLKRDDCKEFCKRKDWYTPKADADRCIRVSTVVDKGSNTIGVHLDSSPVRSGD
jgi:hypothetical protein